VGAADQADPPLTLSVVSSKLRYNDTKDTKLAIAWEIKPSVGITKKNFLALANKAPHPNAAKLMIRWLLGDDKGGAGMAPWFVPRQWAGRFEVIRRITFPIALLALGSAFVLTFSKGLGEFATQAFLGLPIRYSTLSTRIYSALTNRLFGEGYVLSLILIISTAAMVLMNQAILGTRKRFVTIEGKGTRRKPVALRRWRWPAALLILFFVLVFVFGPLLLLGWETLMRYDGKYGFDNLPLHY